MIKLFKKNKKRGYAMLFTVIIVSAISIITAGLINATYKQIILSSLAKDSQLAFYQADTAADCALYVDRVYRDVNPDIFKPGEGGGLWKCGDVELYINPISTQSYSIEPKNPEEISGSCYRINVTKTIDGTQVKTTIKANGYNICNIYNKKTVERTIEVNYSE